MAGLLGPSAAFASPYGAAAWGSNQSWELGAGALGVSSDVPLPVRGLRGVTAMAAGREFTLALLTNGTVMAWGGNSVGQLGDGSTSGPDAVPTAVKGLSGVTAIAARGGHALALLSNGTVMAWGENVQGELGDGTHTGPETCGIHLTPCSTAPVAVKELSEVKAISAGWEDSMALLGDGKVMMWGDNTSGQLGDGSNTGPEACPANGRTNLACSSVPVEVSGLSEVAAVGAGGEHSLALLTGGTVKSWGANYSDQLGDGSETGPNTCGTATETYPCADTPVSVSGLSGVTAISGGGEFSLALLSGGTVKSWGEGHNGELGDGGTELSDVPVAVSGLSGVTAVSAGEVFSLALLNGGSVVAWGQNGSGELGDGTFSGIGPTRDYVTTPVAVSRLSGVRGVATGLLEGAAYGELPALPEPEELFGLRNPGEPNYERSCEGDPVNCATGNLVESQTDLSIGGRGVPLTFTRTYNAQAATAGKHGFFGYGWSSSFSDHLEVNAEAKTVKVVQANGSTVNFKGAGEPGELTAPEWAEGKLVLNTGGTYTYTLPDQETFSFTNEGQLLSESDRDGNTTTMNRNAEGRLESVTDAAGRTLTFSYNSEGLVESVKDPMGHTVKYSYEGGNLASVTLPGESRPNWQFKYDSTRRLTTMTDGRSGVTTNEYDSSNRVISQKDPAERSMTFEYESSQTTITNKATGAITKETFNGGEPESITRGYGTTGASTETFTYNEAAEMLSRTDGRNHTTRYEYDGEGNRTKMTDPDGDETKWEYDHAHDVISETSPMGEKTTIERETHGNPVRVSRPGPGETIQDYEYKWTSRGELESYTDPLNRTWHYEHDLYGDEAAESDPHGDKRTWSYNEDSQEIKTVSPRGNVSGGEPAAFTTTIERDQQGRPTAIVEPELNESAKPVDVSAASVLGVPVEGATLTAAVGVWRGIPLLSYGYQWQRCNAVGAECANVAGATASTHTVVAADLKGTLRVVVTASNSYGSASSTSGTTRVVGTVAPLAYVSSFGSGLNRPFGVAVDPHGNVWVANGYGSNIEKYSASGTLLATYGKFGTGNGEYDEPVGVAINQSTGNVYITDQNNNRVQELNEHGEWVRTWGSEGSGNGQFKEAENVAIGASGHVYVSDYQNDRVQVFEENGTYLSKFGEPGSGNGQFNGPSYIAISSGAVYVGDLNNSRVQTFSEAGEYQSKSGSWGTAIGQFEYPTGIGFSPGGKLFISNNGNNRIEEWTASFGEFLSTFGTHGSGSWQFSEPEGLAFNTAGELFVADTANGRIERWAPPGIPRSQAVPVLEGEVIPGQTLTANPGTWSASPAPTYTYQWERCNPIGASCAIISGATASTYTPGSADYEHTLRVAVKATNSAGSATSDSAITALFLRSRKTEYAYDGDGNIESVTDANGHTTKYTRNADNELTRTEEANGDSTETEWDGAGRIVAQIDGNKHKTKYIRNAIEEVSEEVNPLGKKTLKEYDKAGNLERVTDAAGRTTTMKYDPANRLTEVSYSEVGAHTVSYEYDRDGQRTKMIDGSGATTYERDRLERPTKITDGHSESVAYEWDLANELTKLTYPNGKAVERKYDNAGRLEKTIDWLGNTIAYAYNTDSTPTTTTFPSAAGEEDKTSVNNADQTTAIELKKGSEVLASLTYTRDGDGQLLSTTQHTLPGEEKAASALDEANRLTHNGTTEYTYDPANNPTKLGATTQTFNEADELEKAGTTTDTYNETGERTKTTPATGPATTYGYNQAGDLTSVEQPEGEGKAKIEDSYSYNGEGLRTSETINGTTSYLTWEASENGVPLLLGNGAYSFIYGPGNLPVEQINNTTSAVQYLHHDQQGSTRLITSSTGTVERKCTYSAYGTPTCEGSATTPLGYDAQYTSSDTGLIYLRARVYDPATAQFLSVDPLASLTREPYVYAGDDPLTYKDRSGLGIEEIFEGSSGIPCPWCAGQEAIQEALESAYHEVQHGIEWVNNHIGTEELGEPVEQGAGSAHKGCELLERDLTGKVHTPEGVSLPRYPPADWTDEELEQVAEDLSASISRRKEAAAELGEDSEHRARINEEEELLRSIEKKLGGS